VGAANRTGARLPSVPKPEEREEDGMAMDSDDLREKVQELEKAQATQAATTAGMESTQAAVTAGMQATQAAAQAGTWAVMIAGSAGLFVGIFLGVATAKSKR